VLVILFGAVVRVTGSGAGCGQHWPTCHGEISHLPRSIETLIEYTHRLTSGLSLLFLVGLVWFVWRRTERGHLARRAAWLSLLFLVFEALLGAGLVLFDLVADNASQARAIVMPLHLTNTSLLMLFLTLTAWALPRQSPKLVLSGFAGWLMVLGLVVLLAVSATGAITALGDTLYPIAQGEAFGDRVREVQAGGTAVERLRSLHPLLALFSVLYLFFANGLAKRRVAGVLPSIVMLAVFAQLGVGVVNIWLSAPGWMQVIHLAFANLVWVLWVLLSIQVCAHTSPARSVSST
jgi:heme A synthase